MDDSERKATITATREKVEDAEQLINEAFRLIRKYDRISPGLNIIAYVVAEDGIIVFMDNMRTYVTIPYDAPEKAVIKHITIH